MKLKKDCPLDIETFEAQMSTTVNCMSKQDVLIQDMERELKDMKKHLDLLYSDYYDLCSWIESDD